MPPSRLEHEVRAGDQELGRFPRLPHDGRTVRSARLCQDQRCGRLIEQHAVGFVDDGACQAPLQQLCVVVVDAEQTPSETRAERLTLGLPQQQLVVEIVESELVARSIGNVAAIGEPLFGQGGIRTDESHGQPQAFEHGSEAFGIAPREVVVDRHDVHASAGERVEYGGKEGDECFSFTRLHLDDVSLGQRASGQ